MTQFQFIFKLFMSIKVLCIFTLALYLTTALRIRSHNWKIDPLQNFQKNNKTAILDETMDSLNYSNLISYYGTLTRLQYNTWEEKLANSTINKTNCANSYARKPYIQDLINNQSKCISPVLITNQTDIIKDKILFNLETRQFQLCSRGKAPKCDQLIDQYNKNHQIPFQSATLELCPLARPYYNKQTKLCDDCPVLSQFDGPTQKCLPIVFTSNPEAKKIIMKDLGSLSSQRYSIQQANPSRFIQNCPLVTPYLKGTVCVSCGSDELFNMTSQQCIKGCGKGYFYSVESYRCELGQYFSDVEADNLVSKTDNFNSWKKQIQTKGSGSQKMIKCGSDAPFAAGGACVTCSGSTPLFDIDEEKCVSCQRGRVYDSYKRRCMSYFDNSSSLSRMIANIS